MSSIKIWFHTLIEYDSDGTHKICYSYFSPAKDSDAKYSRKKSDKKKYTKQKDPEQQIIEEVDAWTQ